MTADTPETLENIHTPGIVGRRAPEIQAQWIDANGEPGSFSIAEQRRRFIYLYFFQAWCDGCHRYGFPALQQLLAEFGDHPDIRFAAVQTVFEGFEENTPGKVAELQQQYGLTIPMGHDAGDPNGHPHSAIMQHYRTGGTPWVVIIDPNRKVLYNDFHVDPQATANYFRKHFEMVENREM